MGTTASFPSTREKIFAEILRDIEEQRIVPGQRLAETDLVARLGFGRNAVREAIQLLSERGIVELTPNRSPVIRRFTLAEALGVLDISTVLTGLLTHAAAQNYSPAIGARFAAAMAEIDAVPAGGEREFSKAQRHFAGALLALSHNTELQRIYPLVGMAIFTAQFRSPDMIRLQMQGMREIYAAVTRNDAVAAGQAGRQTIECMRDVVRHAFPDSPGSA